jgi:hypothetical protein
MTLYARYCGMTLARAHARSGDRFALNERDFAALAEAVRTSRVSAVPDR